VSAPKPSAGTIEASVLIPSYDDKHNLLLCIDHLVRQSYPPQRFEVVVVLDGSTDGSREALERVETPFRLRVIEQPNRGRAAALNRAAEAAEGRLLIVTDSDILACPEFVRGHVEAHERGDVVIGPIPLSERSPRNFLTEGVRRWAERHEQSMQGRTGGYACSEIYGANLSIRKDHFDALGGYRTDLRRTEDFQLGKKIIAAGHKIVFCPEARAEHIYAKSIPEWCRDFYQDGISHARFVEEFPDEIPNLKIGRYYPQSLVKRLLRPLVIRGSLAGRSIVAGSKPVLELCRRLGLTWRLLSSWKGVIGDALFWKGVYDDLGDEGRFTALIGRPPDPRDVPPTRTR
jgi:glycosyltransferase involved in cell wall biosynthesis